MKDEGGGGMNEGKEEGGTEEREGEREREKCVIAWHRSGKADR